MSSKICYKIDISRPSVLVILFIYIIDKCAIAYHDINTDFTLKKSLDILRVLRFSNKSSEFE